MKRCIIITAYNPHGFPSFIKQTEGDTVICADGGYHLAKEAGIRPDLIIGDFDSDPAGTCLAAAEAAAAAKAAAAAEAAGTAAETCKGRRSAASTAPGPVSVLPEEDHFFDGVPVVRVPSEKDDTDTMLCIKKGLELGMDTFLIVGGIGGRLDHTVANLQTLAYLRVHGADGMLVDPENRAMVADPGTVILHREPGYKFSLFAFSDRCEGITLTGAKYPLTDYLMENAFPLGISNEFADDTVTVTFTGGRLLIVMSCGA